MSGEFQTCFGEQLMTLGHEKLNKGAFNYVQRLIQFLTGRRCGDEAFIEMLKQRFSRRLKPLPQGRPRKRKITGAVPGFCSNFLFNDRHLQHMPEHMNRQDKLFIGQVGSMDQTVRIMATAPVGPSRPYISRSSSSYKRRLRLVPAFSIPRHVLA